MNVCFRQLHILWLINFYGQDLLSIYIYFVIVVVVDCWLPFENDDDLTINIAMLRCFETK